MDRMERARSLSEQIRVKRRVLARYREEGNQVGARRIENEIKKLQRELNNID